MCRYSVIPTAAVRIPLGMSLNASFRVPLRKRLGTFDSNLSMPSPSSQPTVAIAGGGLAGLASACALSDAGFRVTLFEKRPFLGGRASSWEHPGTGEVVDNCQHVLFRVCTNLMEFYHRIGVAESDSLVRHNDVHRTRRPHLGDEVFPASRSAAHRAVVSAIQVPERGRQVRDLSCAGPAHAHRSARYRTILSALARSTRSNQASGRALLAADPGQRPQRRTRSDFHFRRGAGRARVDEVSRGAPDGSTNSPAHRSLQQSRRLHSRPRRRAALPHVRSNYLTPSASRVTATARRIEPARTIQGHTPDESSTTSSSALPFDALDSVLPDTPESAPIREKISHFETAPITGIHCGSTARSPISTTRFCSTARSSGCSTNRACSPCALQSGNDAATGSYIELVVSSSKTLIDKSRSEIVDLALREVREFFPAARDANLVKSAVIKEVNATYSPRPGIDAHRPGTATAWPRVFLAGDWTATGWPATMEGAVRSGYLAAEALAHAAGSQIAVFSHPTYPQPDLCACSRRLDHFSPARFLAFQL